jgi:serine/threonine-protein kinase
VEVTDFVEEPGLAYLVMELLDGASLRALMKQRGRRYPSLERIVAIVSQVCDALDAAHAKGVIHRDLKPDNVFVVERDGGDFAKVLDFGVAKLHDSLDRVETSAGMILGTPHYMAPEQALGREVDGHADVWAAGVVLYELLAGAVPFTARSFVELATRIREEPPPPLPAKTPRGERIPPALAGVVLRCLEKRPSDRFRSMGALAEALRAPPPPVPRRGRSRSRRLLAPAAAAAAAAALVVVGVVAIRAGLARRVSPLLEPAGRAAQALVAEARSAASPDQPPPHAEPAEEPAGTVGTAERRAPELPAAAPTRAPAHAEPRPRAEAKAPSPAPQRAEAKARAPSAPRVATVELHVRSTPPGASVVRLDTGQRLGKTPLRSDVARKAATIWLQLRLEGYLPVKFAVDLRKDNAAAVTLRRAGKKPARHR